jgi:CMP-N,N'-diacetyllegionaminic acid synthase
MEILGIIPARGGSSQVKKKNIRKLNGKPLISYTIKASKNSLVNRTIVSTDSQEIATISEKYGAEVPFLRPKKYSTNTSSSISVILHCLNFLKKSNYVPDYVVFLQPTSPFRTSSDINNGIKEIIKQKTNSLIGIEEITSKHPYYMFKIKKNNKLQKFDKKLKKSIRRQDLSKLYIPNDAIFISKIKYYDNVSQTDLVFDPNNLCGLPMNYIKSVDINTEFDFLLCENLFKLRRI